MYVNDLYLPAKVYLHTDDDAPVLTAQNLSLVLKACLVTGYGGKPGAGWSMPFEDAAASKRVFRPAIHGNLDNYLRVVDGNAQAVVQSYSDMSDIDNGNKKLELATPYKYARRNFTGQWAIIATERSFMVWTNSYYRDDAGDGATGTVLFYGDSGQAHDGSRCLLLTHTGGNYDDGSYASPFASPDVYPDANYLGSDARAAAVTWDGGQKATPQFRSLFGLPVLLSSQYLAPLHVLANDRIYSVPGVHTDTQKHNNLATFADDGAEYITLHARGGWALLPRYMARLAVRTDRWRY